MQQSSITSIGCLVVAFLPSVLTAAPLVVQVAQIAQPDTPIYANQFGTSVAAYGEWMVVGAPMDADGGSNVGAAYLFRRSEGKQWTFHEKIVPNRAQPEDLFGSAVAINDDWLVVGAPHGHFWTYPAKGTAFVFRRINRFTPSDLSDNTWVQVSKLQSSAAVPRDRFGTSVTLTPEGLLVIGAPGAFDDLVGSVEVYKISNRGLQHEATLVGHDTVINDFFGEAVDADGGTILVGAYRNSDAGAVYVFDNSKGQWLEEQKLLPTEREGFGTSVAIEGDVALVGTPGASFKLQTGIGAAYIFRRQESRWIEEQKLYIPESISAENFGANVQLGNDIAFILAPSGYSEIVTNSISTWASCEGHWYLQQRLKPTGVTEYEAFGMGIVVSGNEVNISSATSVRGFSVEQELNLQSFWYFQRCYTSGPFADPGCAGFDFDSDGEITSRDYHELLSCWQR